jgi:hypothetical protein
LPAKTHCFTENGLFGQRLALGFGSWLAAWLGAFSVYIPLTYPVCWLV